MMHTALVQVNHKKEGYMAEIKALTPKAEGVDIILEMAAHINLGAGASTRAPTRSQVRGAPTRSQVRGPAFAIACTDTVEGQICRFCAGAARWW